MIDLDGKVVTLDTNILVRFLVADDDNQHQKSVAVMEQVAGFVLPTTVLVETVWVLIQSYQLSKADVLAVLASFVDQAQKLIINHDEVQAGLAMLAVGGDFADGINQFLGKKMGGEVFVTFDKKAISKLSKLNEQAYLPI